jgi:hypothetical protein
MEQNCVIETIGSITKMENVISMYTDILENTLVLQNIDPFPGYYISKNLDHQNKPYSVFIILRYRYDPEKVNRIIQEMARNKIVSIYPSFGEIITSNAFLPCIRLKGIRESHLISEIQLFLKNHDLQMMPYQKVDCKARIKIFKTFRIIELTDGIYRDLMDGEKFYFKIPNSLNWKRFEYVTKKIRYNLKDKNFDAALGIIYRFCGTEDVIRIYDNNKTLERALNLKNLYIKEIKNDIFAASSKIISN